MFQEQSIIERHARRTLDELIKPAAYRRRSPVEATVRHLSGEPEPFAAAIDGDFEPIAPGTAWGRTWGTSWFHIVGAVPADMRAECVDLVVDIGFHPGLVGFHVEGMVYTAEGQARHGIHPMRRWHRVSDAAEGGETVDVYVEAAANPMVLGHTPTPFGDPATAGELPIYHFNGAHFAVFDPDAWRLGLEVEFLLKQAHNVVKDGPHRPRIYSALAAAMDELRPGLIHETAPAARQHLRRILDEPGAPNRHLATAIGHAHIDTAWLWPIRETARKCVRTFSNQIELMDAYPEHRFGCSQAAQYEMIERDQPALFQSITERVADGRWVPLGGSWVEADGNLPGGEALVRQHLHGQRYFDAKFGRRCTVGWIPDVFGYPASLPQIMALSGLTHFVTQKLSWNRTNRFPHHTFAWEGLDGTQITTHFPPSDTYNCEIDPYELAKIDRQYSDHARSNSSLVVFGHGDGGGGPTREMLERLRFAADTDGVPRLEVGSPEAFFARVDAESEAATDPMPVWRGELYFEMHRGTYTSQAKTKAGNRRAELLLRQAEWLAIMAYGADPARGYPLARLDRLWKDTLILQFHDILPGSSIAWVHQQAEADYERIHAEVEQLIAEALDRLAAGSSGGAGSQGTAVSNGPVVSNGKAGSNGPVLAFNPAPFDRQEVVEAPDGSPLWVDVAGGAIGPLAPDVPDDIGAVVCTSTDDGGGTMSNGIVRLSWDARGILTSLVHLATGRETLRRGGEANRLEIFDDRPIEYDAWDIEPYYRNRRTVIDQISDLSVEQTHRYAAALRIRRSFGQSTIEQSVIMRAGRGRIDIETDVDWHETDTMLKAAFEVDIHADVAAAEVQFGHVLRPTHQNTTWDLARFEVCAHRWIDVSEPDFGVALLNDSKYGHDTLDGNLRITLLRSAQFPDPVADKGRHRFTYAIYPHAGDLVSSDVIAQGYLLNLPIRLVDGVEPTVAPVSSSNPGVVIESIKAAEDGSGDLIVRLYESRGARGSSTITFDRPVGHVEITNLLEEPFQLGDEALDAVSVAPIDSASVRVELRPFRILTLRVS